MNGRGFVRGAIFSFAVATLPMQLWSAGWCAAEVAGKAEDLEVTPSLVREIQFMLLRLGMEPDFAMKPKLQSDYLYRMSRQLRCVGDGESLTCIATVYHSRDHGTESETVSPQILRVRGGGGKFGVSGRQ